MLLMLGADGWMLATGVFFSKGSSGARATLLLKFPKSEHGEQAPFVERAGEPSALEPCLHAEQLRLCACAVTGAVVPCKRREETRGAKCKERRQHCGVSVTLCLLRVWG